MDLPLFVYVFLVQAVVVGIIIFILRKVLEHLLIDMAIKDYEYAKPEPLARLPAENPLVVLTHKRLSRKYAQRILKVTSRHYGDTIKPVFRVDKSIWGGMVIRVGARFIDCSLKDRIQRAFSQR